MNEIETFLRDAATLAGIDPNEVLGRVLHIGDGALDAMLAPMSDSTRALALRVDRELRLRNPGLHYVERKMFLGYRREGATASTTGERSQIFASLIRNNTRLEVVLPVSPECVATVPYAQDLTGRGHHGVGDVRVSLGSDAEIERFLVDFGEWLNPAAQ